MWIGGPSSLADMDVDCDGNNRSGGKCANDPSGQSMTSFMDQLPQYGIPDLDANIHSFVVLGTSNFDPQSVGIKSLSVVAVVCGGKLVFTPTRRWVYSSILTTGDIVLRCLGRHQRRNHRR